jgi:hypothetical protein
MPDDRDLCLRGFLPSHSPMMLGPGMFHDLVRLTGGGEETVRFVADLARELGRPIVLNVPQPDGSSSSVAIGPPDWSQEKVAGYVGGMHEALAEQFGPVVGRPYQPNRRERRGRGR